MKKNIIRIVFILFAVIALFYTIVFVGHKFVFRAPYSNVPTVKAISKNGFTFGAASIKQPTSFEEYVQVVSKQVTHYQKNIDSYWPNNPEKDQYLLVQNLNNKQSVMISPLGDIKKLSKKDFLEYNVGPTLNTDGQWSPFKKGDISGAYIGVIPDNLTNYYGFQRYEHLGTYDQFLSYSHELFHSITQEKWEGSQLEESNANRDERLEDSQARRYRMLLQIQLKEAISNKENREELTLAALKTYKTYQSDSTDDLSVSNLFDRIEGTAYYYELVSSLYAGYPEQITTQEDVYDALSALLSDDNPAYRNNGATSEGYSIGGFAGILLDIKAIKDGKDPDEWKIEIEQNKDVSPISLLEKEYADNSLPDQAAIPSENDYKNWIREYEAISPSSSKPTIIFNILYGILF